MVLDRVDRGVVHQLQHGRTQLLPDGHDGAGRRVDVGEDGDHRRARRLRRDESQDRAGDDAEGALAADEQLEQAQPGDVLDALAAERHERAVGEHDVETEHVVDGDAVLHAAESPGVGRHVAADRADLEGRRVGRVPEPVLGGGDLHLLVERARLDDGHLALGVDLDGAHALEAEDDAAVDGARATGQTAPRAPGDDWNIVGRRPPNDGLNLACVLGTDHRDRGAGVRVARPVEAVALDDVRVGEDGAVRQCLDELPQRVHGSVLAQLEEDARTEVAGGEASLGRLLDGDHQPRGQHLLERLAAQVRHGQLVDQAEARGCQLADDGVDVVVDEGDGIGLIGRRPCGC